MPRSIGLQTNLDRPSQARQLVMQDVTGPNILRNAALTGHTSKHDIIHPDQ